jgi:DNA gyrase subunit A
MPLRRLARLETEKIAEEYTSVIKNISYLEDLLASPRKVLSLITEDVRELKSKYGDPRRTLVTEEEVVEFNKEDLISHGEMVITLTSQGFIKRVPINTYRLQHRGGRGVMGMVTREADTVRHILVADTHDNLLFFTSLGKVYSLKCYEIPEDTSRTAKGMALVNLLPIDLKDEVTGLLAMANFPSNIFLLMATKAGVVKKTSLDEFARVRRSGLIAMGLKKEDRLVSARAVSAQDEVILVSQNGQAIRFKVEGLRTASRTSGGVRGICLTSDCVIGMDVVFRDAYVLTATQNGFGKLTPIKNYPVHRWGGKGIRACRLNEKTGKVAVSKLVSASGYLMMLSVKGNIERIPIEQISIQGRNGHGVRLMTLAEGDSVVSTAIVAS